MTSLGLDIGGTRVKAALMRDGELVAQLAGAAYERPGWEAIKISLCEIIDVLRADRTPGARLKVDVLGLSIPGVLSDDRSQVTYSANVPGLVNVPLERIPTAIGLDELQPTLATDQIASATDYVETEHERGHSIRGRLLAVSIGTGVGAAVLDVSDAHPLGKALRVNSDSPGHLGQMDVSLDDNPPRGPDGGAGSLEAYLGAAALAGREPATLGIDDPPIRALVRALRICHALYRPHEIVLLGGVGIRLAHLGDSLTARVNDRLTAVARPGWRLGYGTDDFHAARGAARLAEATARP